MNVRRFHAYYDQHEQGPAVRASDFDSQAGELLAARGRIREIEAEVEGLQIALDFWLPNIPDDGPEDMIERMAKDAWRLTGIKGGDNQRTAEDLGWIALRTTSETDSEPKCRDGQPHDFIAAPLGRAEYCCKCGANK